MCTMLTNRSYMNPDSSPQVLPPGFLGAVGAVWLALSGVGGVGLGVVDGGRGGGGGGGGGG